MKPNVMKPQEQLAEVVEIARLAGAEILDVYNSGRFDVEVKGDGSPLTQADQRADRVINQALTKLTPEIPILSEETYDQVGDQRLEWPIYWLVDPLDGTKEFVKRNGEFTVNIALIIDTKPVLGVVYVPVTDVCYTGVIGQGATCQREGGEPEAIKARSLGDEVIMVASRSHVSEPVKAFEENLKAQFARVESISMGSSLKLCLVAEAKADVYPRLGLTSEWDTAAAQAVVEAAGGAVLNCDKQPLRYSKKEILNPWFLVVADQFSHWRCEGYQVGK